MAPNLYPSAQRLGSLSQRALAIGAAISWRARNSSGPT
ncbi:MAG: hypothetical protein FD129_715 [bacterium]|nr:MAG: hypothetical protein FD129_715 [bacterium]